MKNGAFGAELSRGYWGTSIAGASGAWAIISGAAAKFDPINVGASLGIGNVSIYGGAGSSLDVNADYTIANAYAIANLTPTFSVELGAVHDFGTNATDILSGASLFEGGLYWKPKKQFVLGVEGQVQSGGINDNGDYTAAAVTRWSF